METIEFKTTELVVLPDEVKELAQRVPESKQKEVQTILSQIFAGTADWEKQVDAIEVKDINDRMSIQLADTARKNVKAARLAGEKLFDAKRDAVQMEMQNYKLEDSLWLKSKQIMQIKFKAIEEKAEWKARFVERYEAEQKELRTQLRIEKVMKFSSEVNRIEIENMSDNLFDIFLSGLEKAFNDKIEADRKAEEKRLADIEAERVRQENIRLENEKLKKEAEAKAKELEAERKIKAKRNEELKPYIIFIRDYGKMLSLDEEAYQKELADIKRGAKEHYEFEAEQKVKADKERADLLKQAEAERIKRENIEAELKRKKEADDKLKRDAELKLQAEKKAKALAERKAKLAPDREKLLAFGQALNNTPRPEIKSIEAIPIMAAINGMLVRLNGYIVENANKL